MKGSKTWLACCMAGILGFNAQHPLNACTRALYTAQDNTVITGRTMDWFEDMSSELWVFPRGMERNGEAGSLSPKWKSKYGSVIISAYGLASADGMNEKGLVMNMLYLAESDYGSAQKDRPPISISLWGQYALDNFASVAEAVKSMQAHPFQIVAPRLPNGKASTLHLSLSDSTGDSAIFEYIAGKLVVHHGKNYKIMTNSPSYDQQLALDAYWKSIGGLVFLPGTSRAADRFVRISYYIDSIPKSLDPSIIKSVPQNSFTNQAIASVMSAMRAVSVPLGITDPKLPNIASTLWRTVADQTHKTYFFDSSMSPNTFWIDLNKLDFSEGKPVMKLEMAEGQVYSGEVSKSLKQALPFTFMSAVETDVAMNVPVRF